MKALAAALPAALFLAAAPPLPAATYTVSAKESRIRFEIGHEHYEKKVRGRFRAFSGSVDYDPLLPDRVAVSIAIDPASIATANNFRDSHLREAFFETAEHPAAEFTASVLEREGESLRLVGDLTLKGITRTVALALSGAGHSLDAQGRGVLRYRATTVIDRRDFGVEEDAERSAGLKKMLAQVQEGLDELISDEVSLSIFLVAREH